jgi:MoaA/NifB/PqqE/SkfB family radical SAM enzyme
MALRKEQLFRYSRYVTLHLPHLTLKKALNILRVEGALFSGRTDLTGVFPYSLFVDLSNTCNLKCPLCIMGQRQVRSRPVRMDLAAYRRLLTPLQDYLLQVLLYNNSEPFLNKDLYGIIHYTAEQNIGTVISSNLSLPVDADRLVDSGLEYLIVSGDGHTQRIYEQYRVNGRLDTVIANVKNIVAVKQKRKTRFPYIEWQCLVTKKNEDHLKDIKDLAYGLGVDTVRLANLNFYAVAGPTADAEETWLPRQKHYRAYASRPVPPSGHRRPCFWLWRTAIVNCDGGVIPCCLYDTDDWGNALQEPFSGIWNNEYYRKARGLTTRSPLSGPSLVCDDCRAPFLYQ